MRSAEVYIFGQKYTIKGEASEEHMRELAALIEGKVKEITDANPNITPVKGLVLTLFSMANEVHSLRSGQDDLAKGIEEKAAMLTSLFE